MKNLFLVGFAVCVTCAAFGETFVWKGLSGGSWTEPANWEDGRIPTGAGSEIVFNAQGGLSVAVPAALSVGRLRVTAGSLTLDASGGIVFTGGDTPGMDIAEGAGLTLSGRASATAGFVKTGGGTFTTGLLVSGAMTVRAGTVVLTGQDENCWDSSLLIEKDGTFVQQKGDSLPNNYRITVDGGKLRGDVSCDYVGPLTLRNGGEISGYGYLIVDDQTTAYVTVDAGTATVSCPLVMGSPWGWQGGKKERTIWFTVAEGATLDMRGGVKGHWGGDTAYVGGIVKAGGGRLVLSGTNLYFGETVVRDGTLEFAGPGVPDSYVRVCGGALAVADGANPALGGLLLPTGTTLDLADRTLTVGGASQPSLVAGDLSVGRLVKTGKGMLTIFGAGQDVDALDVLAGTVALGGPVPLLHYTFDDPDDLGRDAGKLGRALSIPANATAVAGPRGGAAAVSASAGMTVSGAGLPTGRQSFTLCAWIRKGRTWEDGLGWGPVNTPHQYSYLILAGNSTKFGVYGSAEAVSETVAPDGEFHHYAIVGDFATSVRELRLYLDGACIARKTLSDQEFSDLALNPDGSLLKFGDPSFWDGFDGAYDDIQVFDSALPDGAIFDVMRHGASYGSLADGAAVRLDAPGTLSVVSGTNAFSSLSGRGALHVGAGAKVMLSVAAGETLSVGTVLGDGEVEKTGLGTLELNRATHAGATVGVAAGALALRCGCAGLAAHVVCHYPFDEAAPGADASGHGFALKSVGLTWAQRTSSQPGTAYFDGANGYLTFADDVSASAHAALPQGDGAYTVSFWFNPNPGVAVNGGFFSWGEQAGLQCAAMRFDGDHFYPFNWGFDKHYPNFDRTAFIGPSAPEGWHHVLVTYGTFPDGVKGRRLYVDGALQEGGETYSGTLNMKATRFNIGSCHENLSASPFCGYMDDFILLDCAVGPEQALALMAGLKASDGQTGRCRLAAGTSVSVTSGEVDLASVAAAGPLSVASGLATLRENAVVELDGTSVRVGPLSLASGASVAPGDAATDGTLALPAQATVRYAGTVAGTWSVLWAQTLAGTVADWSGVAPFRRASWRVEARQASDHVAVSVCPPGLSVIVR